MQYFSAADPLRHSEGGGSEIAPGELTRLDRRHFLRSGALTVAGLATLSGVELVKAPAALAQAPISVSPVSNLTLISASATPVPGQGLLHICRHNYRFDYPIDPSGAPVIPPELVATYRLNAGSAYPSAVPGGTTADRLQPQLQQAPFQSPTATPPDPYPPLSSLPATGTPVTPTQLFPLVCYRIVQVIELQTFPVRRMLRVYDWCSLYCYPGNFIVITVEDKCICYFVSGGGTQPPPPPQKNVVDDSPQLIGYWESRTSGNPNTSIGPGYFLTYVSRQGAFSTAVWRAQLNVPEGTMCRVDAHIPGTAQPGQRSAGARYQIFNAGFISANVVRSHQVASSQWVTLGTFPFRTGTFEVRLTDETGEPTRSRVVVADAVRWTSP